MSYTSEAVKRHRQKHMAMLDAIKLDCGCADCGYRDAPEALDFDHLPGTTKFRSINQMAGRYTWERILVEIQKCEVVCSNCHRIRTRRRWAEDG